MSILYLCGVGCNILHFIFFKFYLFVSPFPNLPVCFIFFPKYCCYCYCCCCYYYYVCMIWERTCYNTYGSQITHLWSGFSPFIFIWFPGLNSDHQAFIASSITHWLISLALFCLLKESSLFHWSFWLHFLSLYFFGVLFCSFVFCLEF